MIAFLKNDLIFYVIGVILLAILIIFLLYKENERIAVIMRLIASLLLVIIFIMRLIIQIKMNQPYLKQLFFMLLIIVKTKNKNATIKRNLRNKVSFYCNFM